MNKELAVKFGRASWVITAPLEIITVGKRRNTIQENILKNAPKQTVYSPRGTPAYASKRGTKIYNT